MYDFPPELIDLIIDHLHDNPSTLLSCSQVARSWLASSRFHVFSRVSLDSMMSTEVFNDVLSSQHCTLLPFVRALSIRWQRKDKGPKNYRSNEGFQQIVRPNLLAKLSNVTSLMLCDIPWADIDPKFMIHGFGEEAFPHINRLELYSHDFCAFDIFASVVSSFRNLQSLATDNSYWPGPFDPESERFPMGVNFLSLRELKLGFCYQRDVLDFLCLCGATQVESLSLGTVQPTDVYSIAHFLKASGTALRFLRFGFLSLDAGGDAEDFYNIVDLQYNTNLHTVWIEDFVHISHFTHPPLTTPEEWILQIISKLNSTSLRELVLETYLPVISDSHKQHLAELDNIIASGPQFHRLEELRLLHPSHFTGPTDILDNCLPVCRKKGIIRHEQDNSPSVLCIR